MPKCPSKISPKFPKFLSSLYRAFGIFGLFLGQYPFDDISFINFLIRLVTSKLISWFFFQWAPWELNVCHMGEPLGIYRVKIYGFRSSYHFVWQVLEFIHNNPFSS